jgi:hypothetical protein
VPGYVRVGGREPQAPGAVPRGQAWKLERNRTLDESERGRDRECRGRWRPVVRFGCGAADIGVGLPHRAAGALIGRIGLVHRARADVGASLAGFHPARAEGRMVGRERQHQEERRQTPAEGHHSLRMRHRGGRVNPDVERPILPRAGRVEERTGAAASGSGRLRRFVPDVQEGAIAGGGHVAPAFPRRAIQR